MFKRLYTQYIQYFVVLLLSFITFSMLIALCSKGKTYGYFGNVTNYQFNLISFHLTFKFFEFIPNEEA